MIGWIGSLLLALCGLPQAIQCIKMRTSAGINWYFLLMWFVGEILTLYYVMEKKDVTPLLTNYIINIICLIVILFYKVKDEFKKES